MKFLLDHCILITIDTDFGTLIFLRGAPHAGIIRLPDVTALRRISLMQQVLARRSEAELADAIVTVTENRIRLSWPQS